MSIIVYCKDCGKKIRVPEGPPGRFGKCPQCHARVAIPAEDETAPPPSEKLKKAVAVGAASGEAKLAKAGTGASLPEDASTPPEAHAAVTTAPQHESAPPKTNANEPKESSAAANPAPAPKADAKPDQAPDEKTTPQKPAGAAKGPPPKPRAPTGKAPRIALDLAKIEAAASGTNAEKASNHAKAKGSAVVEQFGNAKWDTTPDLPPSRMPYVLAAIAAALIGLGYGAWYFFLRAEAKRLSPEDRKRLQYEAPAEEDEVKRLREQIKEPASKSSAKSEQEKSAANAESP